MRLKKTILEAVDNQIRENNPPITKATLERLINEGAPETLAKEWIAAALLEEMYDVLKHQVPFNEDRFTKNLTALRYTK